jgi:zinc D-Ala-D-Ala carboxypeptidase
MKNVYNGLLARVSGDPTLLVVVVVILVLLLGWSVYANLEARKEIEEGNAKIAELESFLSTTSDSLASTKGANNDLNRMLAEEKGKTSSFERQIGELSQSVSKLVKLSQTDEELLQKYSKVYFLNENYIPENLTSIHSSYLSSEEKIHKVHTNVLPFLVRLLDTAKAQGHDIKVISAYRAFGAQFLLKQNYKTTFGVGANTFSADQGYSEHQLGTALDFTTHALGNTFESFGGTDAYRWLRDNAHLFGFILSYPEDNKFYAFEPWHWRFVGTTLATRLHDESKRFYDLDQRDIDTYLADIFE